MQKKTIFLLLLVIFLFAISITLAYEGTRPAVIAAFISLGIMTFQAINSIAASAWFQRYGFGIMAGLGLFVGIAVTALYYRGKLRIWRYGATKAAEVTSGRQPAPAPTPTPLATPQATQPTPQPVEEQKEAAT